MPQKPVPIRKYEVGYSREANKQRLDPSHATKQFLRLCNQACVFPWKSQAKNVACVFSHDQQETMPWSMEELFSLERASTGLQLELERSSSSSQMSHKAPSTWHMF